MHKVAGSRARSPFAAGSPLAPFVYIQNVAGVQEGSTSAVESFGIGLPQPTGGSYVVALPIGPVPPVGCAWQLQGNSIVNAMGGLALAVNEDLQLIAVPLDPSDASQQWLQTTGVTSTSENPTGVPNVGTVFASPSPQAQSHDEFYIRLVGNDTAEPQLVVNQPQATSWGYTCVWRVSTPGGPSMPQVVLNNTTGEPLFISFEMAAGLVDTTTPQPVPLAPHRQSLLVPQWSGGLEMAVTVCDEVAPGSTPVASFTVVQRDAQAGPASLRVHDIGTRIGWDLACEFSPPPAGGPAGVVVHLRHA